MNKRNKYNSTVGKLVEYDVNRMKNLNQEYDIDVLFQNRVKFCKECNMLHGYKSTKEFYYRKCLAIVLNLITLYFIFKNYVVLINTPVEWLGFISLIFIPYPLLMITINIFKKRFDRRGERYIFQELIVDFDEEDYNVYTEGTYVFKLKKIFIFIFILKLFYVIFGCVVLFGNNMDHGIYAFCMLGLLLSICFDFGCIDKNYFKKSIFILYDDKEKFVL